MGTWTITSAIIRIYTSYNINDPSAYLLCLVTFVIAFLSTSVYRLGRIVTINNVNLSLPLNSGFMSEVFVYKTAPLSSPGVWPALMVCLIMIFPSRLLSFALAFFIY